MPRDYSPERRPLPAAPTEIAPRQQGLVIPFPVPLGRPARPAPANGEVRGEVVLFLGVRYERLAS